MIPVPYIEYVNVRIRSYHSQLFPRDVYEDLVAGDNLGTMTTFLLDQPIYRNDIQGALEGVPEREGLERGVNDHFVRRTSEILHMTDGKNRRLFQIALSSFDLRNLRVILLARRRGLPFHNIRDMIVPCGSLDHDKLLNIFTAADFDEIVQSLSTCCPIVEEAMRKAVSETTDKDPSVKILNRLEHYFYRNILKLLATTDDDIKILRDIFSFEIDLKNIISALKFVWEGTLPGKDNFDTYISGGSINTQLLHDLSHAAGLDEAMEMIESTQFHRAVEKGIIYYAETGFLHEMERFFEELFINKALSYRRFHPFGLGVFIGYIWGQFVEMTNLRTIINGIAFKTGTGQIRKGLIYV